MSDLKTLIFAREIAKNLFRDPAFIQRSRKEDEYVKAAQVFRPSSGATPTVVVDRATNTLPATPSQRDDSNASYALREFTSSPTLLRNAEEVEASYNKRADVLSDHIAALEEQIGNYALTAWAPLSANVISATGAAGAGSGTSVTGQRKMVSLNDIIDAAAMLDNMEIPQAGRVMIMTGTQLAALRKDADVKSMMIYGQKLEKGAIAQLYGFDIYVRSKVIQYTTAGVLRAYDHAGAATDNAGILFYHENFVARAMGPTKVLLKEDDPQFYGSVLSCLQRFGADTFYNSSSRKGIGVIREAATS